MNTNREGAGFVPDIHLMRPNIQSYLDILIRLMSQTMKEENRLKPKELVFFKDVCYLKYLGVDIANLNTLKEEMTKLGNFTNDSTIEQYKSRIGAKLWAKTGHGVDFEIPPTYDLAKREPGFTIRIDLDELNMSNETT